ncbi:MAG: hypothetical protein ACI9FB_003833 [Candidatus Azotimanducaceae bacterium]|jgi:hypothetical protein
MNDRPKRRAESLSELGEIFMRSSTHDKEEENIASYQPRAADVLITPFGKSGTTWTQQIFHTLRTRGDMDFDDISRVVPWIETSGNLAIDINAEQRAEPRGFKSHLAYDKIPKGAKYINVIRHPVDAAYSLFKFMEGWFIEPGAILVDEFVMMTARDQGYHKHFISWWPHRNDDSVLYLVYEHMLADPEGTIEKIAKFSGVELDDELRAITLEHASLAFMQKHKDRFDDAMMRKKTEETILPHGSDSAKVRAGKSGVNTLSTESIEVLNQIWRDTVTPVTGFDTYEELIASLA